MVTRKATTRGRGEVVAQRNDPHSRWVLGAGRDSVEVRAGRGEARLAFEPAKQSGNVALRSACRRQSWPRGPE